MFYLLDTHMWSGQSSSFCMAIEKTNKNKQIARKAPVRSIQCKYTNIAAFH